MSIWQPDKYTAAWNYASRAHRRQTMPGSDVPYLNHLANVAMEVMTALVQGPALPNPDLAVQCALLHDTLEDTGTTFEELVEAFGPEVAAGVEALSKDKSLVGKAEQMARSLEKIRRQPQEIWMVKLADRISNLQPPPPHWSREKAVLYREEASTILEALGPAHPVLAGRLGEKIRDYRRYC